METQHPEHDDFFGNIKEYIHNRIELARLLAVEKSSTVIAGIVAGFIIVMILFMTLLFFSFAAGLAVSDYFGNRWAGFAFIGGFYLLVAGLLYSFRKNLLIGPVADVLIRNMLKENKNDN